MPPWGKRNEERKGHLIDIEMREKENIEIEALVCGR